MNAVMKPADGLDAESGSTAGLRLDPAWPQWLKDEFTAARPYGHVGMKLVSTSERVRVWHILLRPGERHAVHTHVLDDFWTVVSAGRGRLRFHDGRTIERSYVVGDTEHSTYAAGEFMMHDVENIGQTDLSFVTVEFLDSANAPLPTGPQQ